MSTAVLAQRRAALMRRTLNHIVAHPEEWDQEEWICGSVACFVGHAVLLSGARLCDDDDEQVCLGAEDLEDPRWTAQELEDGCVSVVRYGPYLLGLEQEEFDQLAGAHNTLRDLEQLVQMYESAAAHAAAPAPSAEA